jgi:cystathionine beta-lyase
MREKSKEATLLQHAGEKFRVGKGLSPAIEMSVTYQTESVDEVPVYARLSNTNNHFEVEAMLAALHEAEAAAVFGSGMAAFTAVALTFFKEGDHVILQENCYATSQNFFTKIMARFGVEASIAPIENWENLIRSNTRMLIFETISNPFCIPQDLAQAVALGKKHGILTLCDNTFASPMNCRPGVLGVDLVLESATKYLNGHADLVAGAVVGSTLLLKKLRETAMYLGGFLSTTGCVQLLRGLRTLKIRMEAHNSNGLAFVKALRKTTLVDDVCYGLSKEKEHLSALFENGFGGMCAVRFSSKVNVKKMMREFKLIYDAPSLGSTETTACMPAFTTHKWTSLEEQRRLGIDEQLVRFSIGLEDAEDIANDVMSTAEKCMS